MSTPGTGANLLIWTLMIVYLLAFVVLFVRGVAAAHGLRVGRAWPGAMAGLAVYQAVFVLFNR